MRRRKLPDFGTASWYLPSASVKVPATFCPFESSSTCAFGTTAPRGSVTTPRTVDARDMHSEATTNMTMIEARSELFMFSDSSSCSEAELILLRTLYGPQLLALLRVLTMSAHGSPFAYGGNETGQPDLPERRTPQGSATQCDHRRKRPFHFLPHPIWSSSPGAEDFR